MIKSDNGYGNDDNGYCNKDITNCMLSICKSDEKERPRFKITAKTNAVQASKVD